MFTVEVIPCTDKEYQLIHGHCSHYPDGKTRCTNPATVMLIDDIGDNAPGSKSCEKCAQETIDEYAVKLGLHWTTEPLELFHVHGQRDGTEQVIWGTFYKHQDAQDYADELKQEQQE